MTPLEIRTTTEADLPIILQLIRDLAEYEREPEAVVATEPGLRKVLFGSNRSAEVLLALEETEPVGFAVSSTIFRRGWGGRAFISRIFSSNRRSAGKDMVAPCWNGWRKLRRNGAAAGWNGRSWIGKTRDSVLSEARRKADGRLDRVSVDGGKG